jgi:hypothetical protein
MDMSEAMIFALIMTPISMWPFLGAWGFIDAYKLCGKPASKREWVFFSLCLLMCLFIGPVIWKGLYDIQKKEKEQ